ncbi:MAG: hypothetical protein FJ405_04685 [Verrucomicrobia bacterium]|nr:hypothetical protein [Verrucomicrobiota bacterium]
MATSKLEVSLQQLEHGSVKLQGELTPDEAGMDIQDELIHLKKPLLYDLTAERLGESLLITGSVQLIVDCECARCLRPFVQELRLDSWACHVPLEGEDRAEVLSDCVDLTPYIREDIVLALPQHPLCDTECSGLPGMVNSGTGKKSAPAAEGVKPNSVWDQLDKLKLR